MHNEPLIAASLGEREKKNIAGSCKDNAWIHNVMNHMYNVGPPR